MQHFGCYFLNYANMNFWSLVTLKAKWMEITGACLLSPHHHLQLSWWQRLPGQRAHPPCTHSHQQHRCRTSLLKLTARPSIAPASCVYMIFQILGLPFMDVKSLLFP